MLFIAALVLFPLIAAAALLLIKHDKLRSYVVFGAAGLTALLSVIFAALYLTQPAQFFNSADLESFYISPQFVSLVTFLVSAALCLYIVAKTVNYKNGRLATVFALIQLLGTMVFELTAPHSAAGQYLYIDTFSVIMALIIGVIGSAIAVYAVGYMRDWQKHEDSLGNKDRRPSYFALIFLFLSAMFFLVFANNLSWLLCAWEVTSVSSFAMIGFKRTPEARDNAFRQIKMNLSGSIAFLIAIMLLAYGPGHITELNTLVLSGISGANVIPIFLLCYAAFTKAALLPFRSWLLGAMVAPSPTSALVHSATMVKAAVFLLIKLSPVMSASIVGPIVVLVGLISFLACSCMAIASTDAKELLANSTIANLGLVAACAGLGTPEAMWCGIFLIVFHAAAKATMFMCVGTAEHHVKSRDIEQMDDLFATMPTLARIMALGVLAMFVAPFGMLVGKWGLLATATMSQDYTALLILAFGSAATVIFWAKWLGKLLSAGQPKAVNEHRFSRSERWSMLATCAVCIAVALLLPWASTGVVQPFIERIPTEIGLAVSTASAFTFSIPSVLAAWSTWWHQASFSHIAFSDLIIMTIIVAITVGFCLRVWHKSRQAKSQNAESPIYLAGVGVDFDKHSFANSMGKPEVAVNRNWYLTDLFSAVRLGKVFDQLGILLLVLGFVYVLLVAVNI